MSKYVVEKKHEKDHKSCSNNTDHQLDMNSKVKMVVQSTLAKANVKNDSLYNRFEKKPKVDKDVLEMQKTLETNTNMFKQAATHIEAHIPEISKDHAKVIDNAL